MVRPLPKTPRTPPAALRRDPADLVKAAPLLWRVHRTQGAHVLPWNVLRSYGPLSLMRFDPHPEPIGQHAEGVMYAGTAIAGALSETFQATRTIDTASYQPQLTAWRPTRELRLLDLTGTWALRNQAAYALSAAPKPTCRAWARAIRGTWPDLDGLWAPSTMTGAPNVVLWNPAASSFPASPSFSRPLADPTVRAIVTRVASRELGYRVV